MSFGLAALRRFREQQKGGALDPERRPSLLAEVSPDAPMDDATITVWNGERFVAHDKWLATAPVVREDPPGDGSASAIPGDIGCVVADCGGTRVWLVREGERWMMFPGSRKASGRRRDFASPFLAHAIRTAEQWYGAPCDGWRDGKEAER